MANLSKPTSTLKSSGNYKMEIQIGILGIIAGLGFFKIDELTSFITTLSHTLQSSGLESRNLFLIVFITATIFLYLLYLITFGIALIKLYKGQDILNIILYTVSFYFAMYFLIIVLMLQDPEIMENKPELNKNEDNTTKIDKLKEEGNRNTADNILYMSERVLCKLENFSLA